MNTLVLIVSVFFIATAAMPQDHWKKVREEFIVADPAFRQCHASTIVAISPDTLMAAWFAGSHEGASDVNIYLSIHTGGSWTPPVVVATGIVNDSLRYPTWNPVLFRSKSGKLFLFYKVGPSPREWWGMFLISTDNGRHWSDPVKLAKDILGPIKNKPVQLEDGTILSGSSTETNEKWQVHIERSDDDGISWTKVPVDHNSKFDVIQPSILHYPNGQLQILCRSKQGRVVEARSTDNGKTWGKLSATTLINPNSGTDAVTLQSGRQFIVYNPDLPGKDWFNGRAKLRAAISTDGIHWTDVATLENGDKEEFSYPAVIQTGDGRIHITYTWDRKNIKYVVLEP